MHPVADKLKLKAFEGSIDILGKTREVSFIGAMEQGGETIETAVLSITGLSVEEAWDVISRLHGPVSVVASAKPEEPKPKASQPPTNSSPPKPATKPELPKAPPKQEPVKAAEPEPEDLDDDLSGEGEGADDRRGLDVAFMAKQDKVRPVIEYMIARGHNTPEKILAACQRYKDEVPTIKAIDAKGNFDKRIERSAMIILSGDAAAS